MAMKAKSTTVQYLDADPKDFSDTVQALLREEREIYDLLKAQQKKVLEAVRAEMEVPEHMEIVRTAYTRWGQWQVIVDDKPQAKPGTARKTLADFLAQSKASGHNV